MHRVPAKLASQASHRSGLPGAVLLSLLLSATAGAQESVPEPVSGEPAAAEAAPALADSLPVEAPPDEFALPAAEVVTPHEVPTVSIPAGSMPAATTGESKAAADAPVILIPAESLAPVVEAAIPKSAPEQVIEQIPGLAPVAPVAPVIQVPLAEVPVEPAPEVLAAPPVVMPPLAPAKTPLLVFSSPQALRFSVYQRLAEAERQAEAQAVPAAGRVNLYVAIGGLNRVSIASLKVQIDEQAALVERSLVGAEIEALAERRNPLRLARTTLASGKHRVQASVALAADADTKGEPQVLQLDQTFDLAAAGDLELRVDTGTFGRPRLLLRRMLRDESRRTSVVGTSLDALGLNIGVIRYPPGADNDPALGHARSLARMGKPATALVELLAEAVPSGPNSRFEAPYWLEQAALLRQLGVLDRAQAICDQLDAARVAGAAVASERLAIAEARYSAGDYAAAESQLALSQRKLPEYRRADWRNVSGLIELARLRPGDATDTLKVANSESIDAFRYMAASTEALRATGYGRYNLAIAMIRSGDAAHGKSWLDLLGRSTPTDPELLELRDKANLALGWQFLKERQGRTALGVLGRVRTDGLSSNRALLGMGWAQLAPNGERLPRTPLRNEAPRAPDQLTDLPAPLRNSLTRLKVLEPELTTKLGPVSFERDDPPKDRDEGLRRAITVWSVLLDRDDRDPAVLEARLAIAHAQDQLRDIGAARASYADTLASLRGIDAAIERDLAFVQSGELVQTLSGIDTADNSALYGLMNRLRLEPGAETAALYAAVGDQLDYRQLADALQAAKTRLEALPPGEDTAAVLAKLETASRQIAISRREAEALVGQRALVQLQAHREVVRDYMKVALLLAARAEDTPSLEMRNSEAAPTP